MSGFAPPKFLLNDPRLWRYRAYVVRVVDGDTAILYVDKGFHDYSVVKVRLAGIDAPEIRPHDRSHDHSDGERKLALAAANRLRALIEHKEVIVETAQTSKLGKWLARVFVPGDANKTVNSILLEEGLAVKYGDPRPWRGERRS